MSAMAKIVGNKRASARMAVVVSSERDWRTSFTLVGSGGRDDMDGNCKSSCVNDDERVVWIAFMSRLISGRADSFDDRWKECV